MDFKACAPFGRYLLQEELLFHMWNKNIILYLSKTSQFFYWTKPGNWFEKQIMSRDIGQSHSNVQFHQEIQDGNSVEDVRTKFNKRFWSLKTRKFHEKFHSLYRCSL